MNIDENVDETLSSTIEPQSATSSRRSRVSTVDTHASPSLRRSIRLRQTSGESSSPLANRLLHRTHTGGISGTLGRVGRQSTATRRVTNNSVSIDRHTITAANAHASTNSRGSDVEDISNLTSTSNPNQSAPLIMGISSDDDAGGNNSSTNSRSMRSVILEYFVEEEKGFRCKICKEVYKASRMSDSNLRLHLGTVHMLQQFLFPSQRKSAPSQKQVVSNERRVELNRAAINFIVDDSLPFSAFRRQGMKVFLSVAVPGYTGPNRSTERQHVYSMYKKHRMILRTLLADVPWIALTADTWMNCRRKRFICLTGHFFTRSFEHISLVLGFRRIFGRSVASTLRLYIDHEIRRLKIPAHRIISITTDGGSDIRKATCHGQFGQPILCLTHILHLVVTKGLCIWKKRDDEKFILIEAMNDLWIDDDVASDDEEAEMFNDDDNNNNEQSENDQSSERDTDLSLDDDEENDNEIIPTDSDDPTNQSATASSNNASALNLLLRCHSILMRIRLTVKFIRNNSIVQNYVRIQRSLVATNTMSVEKEVVLDLRIRWNSTYLMLIRFLSHKDIITTIVTSPGKIDGITKDQMSTLKTFVFTHEEWDLILFLQQVLEPFVIATKVLSGRNYPTIGLSMFVCRNLASFLQQDSSDSTILSKLKKSLLFQFNHYLNEKVEETQRQYMLMAAFLEPTVYCRLTEEEKRSAKKQIMIKLKSMDSSSTYNIMNHSDRQQTTTNSSPTTSNSASSTNNSNILDQFSQMCGLSTRIISTPSISTRLPTHDEELSLYVSEAKHAGDFRSFWNKNNDQLPRLSQMARKYCVIPASSVASEAAFSRAGYLQRKQRSSLSSKALQYSMILKDRQLVERLQSSTP